MFYFDLGQRLEDQRRYADAEISYKKAAELQPGCADRMERWAYFTCVEGARRRPLPLLDKGFEADKFNIRVANMWRGSKTSRATRVRTQHLTCATIRRTSSILARSWPTIWRKSTPTCPKSSIPRSTARSLIEVFNNHQMFSGRVVAVPTSHGRHTTSRVPERPP